MLVFGKVFLLTLLVGGLLPAMAAPSSSSSIQRLQESLAKPFQDNTHFCVTGTVIFLCRPAHGSWTLSLSENNKVVSIYGWRHRETIKCLRIGNLITACGKIERNKNTNTIHAECSSIKAISTNTVVNAIRSDDFFSDGNLSKAVRIRGIVRDAFYDESAPDWLYLTLNCDGRIINATIFAETTPPVDPLTILGKEIELVGRISESSVTPRKHAGRILVASDLSDLKPLNPDPIDEFDVPLIDFDGSLVHPEEITSLGLRRINGCVRAVWRRNNVLVETDNGTMINLVIESGQPPPWGSFIEAIGLPDTNYYHLQLEHARWRTVGTMMDASEPASRVSPRQLLMNVNHQRQIDIRAHGKPMRVEGQLRHVPDAATHDMCFYIESDGFLIPVDISSAPDILKRLETNSRVAATGICIVECSAWASSRSIPKAQGIRITVRRDEDVEIISRPSRWTPDRIWSVIVGLIISLLSIIIWNVILHRVAARKGRELAREQIIRAEAELRIDERTRLAIELHDTLSQNLLGVAMKLDAVERSAAPYDESLHASIRSLSAALKMSRSELRNCLFDLRSDALEAPTVEAAIRKTLAQYIDNPLAVAIRFNVPRQRLTDQTTHALLRIVRELTLNAFQHGKATNIRIAGSLDDGTLLFSVQDNGCGFDPDTAPGTSEGHFGLQGIRERVDLLRGRITIESHLGKGTKVSISITNSSIRNKLKS